MKIVADDVRRLSLEPLRPFVRDNHEFYGAPGKEHYALLAYLSTRVSGRTIFDIGTHRGDSAMALSLNRDNRVISFDLVDKGVPEIRRLRDNVCFCLADLWDPAVRETWKSPLLSSAIISIDIDPHEGRRELEFVEWLMAEQYAGIVILDDIWYFKDMRDRLWSRIHGDLKCDVTPIGHWSGTGLVSLYEHVECDAVPKRLYTGNWTLVTGYFDLTTLPDATPEIQARPPTHYLDDHAGGTLGLDQNLVIFTEPKYEQKIWDMRPRWLWPRTDVVVRSFDTFPMWPHLERIIENRNGPACARDRRNTASYYLFCMARSAMLKSAMRVNRFESTHFGWINICIERMGFRNLAHLAGALACNRSKFSCAQIDYIPKSVLGSLPAFFGREGCRDPHSPERSSMCSGFFTGDVKHMTEVTSLVETKFLECLALGYGHADEQLFGLVHADRPGLFDLYPADYTEMVTNYAAVHERPGSILNTVIAGSLAAGDRAVTERAVAAVWDGYVAGKCQLTDRELEALLHARSTCTPP